MSTDYHSQYFAHLLSNLGSGSNSDRLTGALAGAQVDLNPHQVEAALFAFQSPLSRGAILADEVGLGKTIEAALVLSQKWAERKRRLLIIAPCNLRKQWSQELQEKFFLPSRILDTALFKTIERQGGINPFECNEIVICSYQFAANKAESMARVAWDLVVIDEAHRLRNVYKADNLIANTLKVALGSKRKLLLTATPLQNSIMELFGLVSFIDENVFGNLKSFREQFAHLSQEQAFKKLKARLKPICHRTLRQQVTPYVSYTARLPILEEFSPEPDEEKLYNLVTDYLQQPSLYAFPERQRPLMTLVLRRLLASSTFAAAGALETIAARLNHMMETGEGPKSLVNKLELDCEGLDEIAEELNLESDENDDAEEILDFDPSAVKREQDEVKNLVHLAASIKDNAKGKALIQALRVGFAKMRELGAAEKAIIFTESRRTQNYLLRILEESEFSEGLIPFNGTNSDDRSKSIYANWLIQNQNTDRITGAKSADMRAALVDYFRKAGRIMIATEAGAEGINLQFCSMIVNYDLPWNPQRIEQRIGRCHRYGQKHDVVVINFLNRNNAADQQVYKLLSEKLRLFEGVFGASDEILGAIENGVDFEKRISEIYQQCRKTDEIKTAFDQIQIEMSMEINESLSGARRKLLENFDEEVREKLKLRDMESKEQLNRHEHMLMELSRYELADDAEFIDDQSFRLIKVPNGIATPTGLHELPRRGGSYRVAHPLADGIISRAKLRKLPVQEIEFNSRNKKAKYKSGWLSFSNISVQFEDYKENYPLLSGAADTGEPLSQEFLKELFSMAGHVIGPITEMPSTHLIHATDIEHAKIQQEMDKRNKRFFNAEVEKLDGWAEDLKLNLEREIKEIDIQLKEARRPSSGSSLEEKLAIQKKGEAARASKKREKTGSGASTRGH